MGIPGGIEDHPDLKDEAWIRAANKRAKQEIRAQRRRARMRAHSGKIVTAIALAVTGAVVFGLVKAGTFSDLNLSLPDMSDPYSVNTEVPFAGTPAEQWADGEKGIVIPDQDPEFAPVYEAVRKALIAAHIDPKMVVERNPEAFFAMLAQPTMEAVEEQMDTVVLTRTKEGTKLLGIKVDGRMWPGRDEHNQPVVHTSYRFAYAFDPGERKSTLLDQNEMVAMVRADVDFQLDAEGLWMPKVEGYFYSMACEASDQGFLAPMFVEKRPKPTGEFANGDEDDWYASSAPMPTTSGCPS